MSKIEMKEDGSIAKCEEEFKMVLFEVVVKDLYSNLIQPFLENLTE